MSDFFKGLKTIAVLTIPAWGIFLFLITLRSFPHSVGEAIAKALDPLAYILAILLILFGFSPIYKKSQWSIGLKIGLGFFYLIFAVLAMFIFGWAGACINKSCH